MSDSNSVVFASMVFFHLGSSMFLSCLLLTMFCLSLASRWADFWSRNLESAVSSLEKRSA